MCLVAPQGQRREATSKNLAIKRAQWAVRETGAVEIPHGLKGTAGRVAE